MQITIPLKIGRIFIHVQADVLLPYIKNKETSAPSQKSIAAFQYMEKINILIYHEI